MITPAGAAVAALLLAPSTVAAAAGPSATLSAPGSPAVFPFPAPDVTLWTDTSGTRSVWGATRSGASWSAPERITSGIVFDVASGGGTTLAAVGDARLGAPIRVLERAGGAWTPVAALGTPAATDAAVAVNARGDAVIAWQRDAGAERRRVFVAWRRAGGAWSAPKRLGTTTPVGEGDVGLRAALDDRGRGTVVWTARGTITAAAGVVAGRWGAPRTYGNGYPQVVAAGSRTLVTWVGPDTRTIRLAGWGAFRLTPPRVVLRAPANVAIAAAVPGVNAGGVAVIAYTPQTLRSRRYTLRVVAVTGVGNGPWSAPSVLSGPATPIRATAAAVPAVAADGTIGLAWRRNGRVEAVTGRPGAPWSPVADLGTANSDTIPLTTPGLATGARVTWADASRSIRVADLTHP